MALPSDSSARISSWLASVSETTARTRPHTQHPRKRRRLLDRPALMPQPTTPTKQTSAESPEADALEAAGQEQDLEITIRAARNQPPSLHGDASPPSPTSRRSNKRPFTTARWQAMSDEGTTTPTSASAAADPSKVKHRSIMRLRKQPIRNKEQLKLLQVPILTLPLKSWKDLAADVHEPWRKIERARVNHTCIIPNAAGELFRAADDDAGLMEGSWVDEPRRASIGRSTSSW